jgi:hypothetical protein
MRVGSRNGFDIQKGKFMCREIPLSTSNDDRGVEEVGNKAAIACNAEERYRRLATSKRDAC